MADEAVDGGEVVRGVTDGGVGVDANVDGGVVVQGVTDGGVVGAVDGWAGFGAGWFTRWSSMVPPAVLARPSVCVAWGSSCSPTVPAAVGSRCWYRPLL